MPTIGSSTSSSAPISRIAKSSARYSAGIAVRSSARAETLAGRGPGPANSRTRDVLRNRPEAAVTSPLEWPCEPACSTAATSVLRPRRLDDVGAGRDELVRRELEHVADRLGRLLAGAQVGLVHAQDPDRLDAGH